MLVVLPPGRDGGEGEKLINQKDTKGCVGILLILDYYGEQLCRWQIGNQGGTWSQCTHKIQYLPVATSQPQIHEQCLWKQRAERRWFDLLCWVRTVNTPEVWPQINLTAGEVGAGRASPLHHLWDFPPSWRRRGKAFKAVSHASFIRRGHNDSRGPSQHQWNQALGDQAGRE